MAINPELIEERFAATKAEGLVESPCRSVLRPSQEADSGEAELTGEIDGRSYQRPPDPAATVFGEDVQLVEVQGTRGRCRGCNVCQLYTKYSQRIIPTNNGHIDIRSCYLHSIPVNLAFLD